jgi:hypothetical protein
VPIAPKTEKKCAGRVRSALAQIVPNTIERVRLPLVRSKHPETLDLDNERIAEILEAEEVANFARFFKQTES